MVFEMSSKVGDRCQGHFGYFMYVFIQQLHLRQDMTQGQFLSRVKMV